MAASSRGVFGGGAVLAVVSMVLGCLPQGDKGAKEGAVQDAARPGPKPQLTVDLGGRVTMELILIPPGTFDMGSAKGSHWEKPIHRVTLKKAFYIGKYEVTQEQWQAVMGVNPSEFKDPKKPVESVSWNACRGFVAKLNEKTGRTFALPSEAEWEYACRAGSNTDFCYGDDEAGLRQYAWYGVRIHKHEVVRIEGNRMWYRDGPSVRVPAFGVGRKKPNKFGLFDMYGNVWEWCEDMFHHSYEGAPSDGSAWVEGADLGLRVLRGGDCESDALSCRSASRYRYDPALVYYLHGCRVVLRDF